MINEMQEKLLKKKIKKIIREVIKENNFFENGYFETEEKNEPKSGNVNKKGSENTRQEVEKWVGSSLQKDSRLAYELWPEKDKDTARSLFAKKANGKDANGNAYEFTEPEIVKLANIKDDYLEEID